MDTKICTKCNKELPLLEYSWKNEKRGWRRSFCKSCHSAYRRSHYLKNLDKYIKKARRWNGQQTVILRKFILEYLSVHPCIDCGNKDIRVLDFDHGNEKFMGICLMIRRCYSLEKVKEEIKKCEVRCANCHRIKTFNKGGYWKSKIKSY